MVQIVESTSTEHSTFTCKFLVEFNGSLAELAANPNLQVWKLKNSAAFTGDMNQAEKDVLEEKDLLKHGLLIAASVEKLYSTFPVGLGIDVVDIKSKMYHDSNGNDADYFVFPLEKPADGPPGDHES